MNTKLYVAYRNKTDRLILDVNMGSLEDIKVINFKVPKDFKVLLTASLKITVRGGEGALKPQQIKMGS